MSCIEIQMFILNAHTLLLYEMEISLILMQIALPLLEISVFKYRFLHLIFIFINKRYLQISFYKLIDISILNRDICIKWVKNPI